MELKKIITRLITFLLCSLACYVLVIYLLCAGKCHSGSLIYSVSDMIVRKGGNTFQKFSDFDVNKYYDVLVIGSSHAYRGYDPEIFEKSGVELFNLGTSGQTPLNTYFLAAHYIKQGHCKLVIIDVYDGALTSDGVESTADLMQNISSTGTVLKMGIALKDPRILNMLMVRLFNSGKKPEYKDKTYTINGFSKTYDSLKYVDQQAYCLNEAVNPAQLYYLEKTIQYLKKQQINIKLVTHPAPVEWDRQKHKMIHDHVMEIASRYKVEYMDYFNYDGLDSRNDFYDSHHLNQSGVQKFNRILIQDLKQRRYNKNEEGLTF